MRQPVMRTLLVRFAVALAATGLLATAANAQSTQRFVGNFTLPCETSWNHAVLPAGDYTMTVRSLSSSEFIRIDAAQGEMHTFVPLWITGSKAGDVNVLLLTRTGKRCVVRSLSLADLDIEIKYKPITREERRELNVEESRPGRVLALVLTRR